MNHQAIYNTHPTVASIDDSRGCFDADGEPVAIDQSLVDAEIDRLNAEADANAYKSLRAAEYKPVGDQLDALLKHLNYRRTQGDELIQELDDIIGDWLAVKSRHPKP